MSRSGILSRLVSSVDRRNFSALCLVSMATFWLLNSGIARAQGDSAAVSNVGIPFMNAGPDSGFAQMDFAQIYLDNENKREKARADEQARRKRMVEAGTVSALDFEASNKAVEEFNRASTLMKAQHSREAIPHLQKAIAAYPKFVTAHNSLGLAYLDAEDPRAKDEFEAAAKLDAKFPGSFLNLGLLALQGKDFSSAESNLEKAASLSPKDPKILSALAFAENGDKRYAQTLETVQRVHALDHRGMANVHYIAAAAAVALNDLDNTQRELTTFLAEDPTNPLAPTARRNLDALTHRNGVPSKSATPKPAALGTRLQTFPNSDRLAAQLNAVKDEPGSETESSETASAAGAGAALANAPVLATPVANSYVIRKAVDETALFFAVSSHGKMVSDLDLKDVQLKDDGKSPQKISLFLPQSKLPLRLGLLIDTSGSVQSRFSFEKHAASKFLEKVLNGTSDLGFVEGFSDETLITQDFTANAAELGNGIDKLTNRGGTALFDAVSLACWKLASYPEQERVAKVLVVLSDGEDNSSHRSLKQAIQDAETSGVTVYTLSTREVAGEKTDADKILDVLAERSGGESMFPGDILTLDKALERLRELIRSRYLIAYKAADFEPNGKYRTVHITAERDGQKMRVHARKGYFARVEAPQQN